METKNLRKKIGSKTGITFILIGMTGVISSCSGYLPDFRGGHWPSPNPQTIKSETGKENLSESTLQTTPLKPESREDENSPKILNEFTESEKAKTENQRIQKEAIAELENTTTVFIVKEPGLSLSLISLILYGTTHEWPEIAKRNQIQAPFHIQLGQKLLLRKSASISKAQFNRRLLEIWRSRLGKRRPSSKRFPAQENLKTLQHMKNHASEVREGEGERAPERAIDVIPQIANETKVYENEAISDMEANSPESPNPEPGQEDTTVLIEEREAPNENSAVGEDSKKFSPALKEAVKIGDHSQAADQARDPSSEGRIKPIHFTDFIRKITFNKETRNYEFRFKTKSKLYTTAAKNTIYYCIKIAHKHKVAAKIRANRITHEVFGCQ